MQQLTIIPPTDRSSNWAPLSEPPDISRLGYHVGTSGYYFDDWVGLFNPPRATKRQQSEMTAEQRDDQDRLRFYQILLFRRNQQHLLSRTAHRQFSRHRKA